MQSCATTCHSRPSAAAQQQRYCPANGDEVRPELSIIVNRIDRVGASLPSAIRWDTLGPAILRKEATGNDEVPAP